MSVDLMVANNIRNDSHKYVYAQVGFSGLLLRN